MRKTAKVFFLAFGISALCSGTWAGPEVKGNTVSAVVNGKQIYMEDIQKAFESLPPNLKGDFNKIYPMIRDQEVQAALILELANREGWRNDPAVRKEIARATDRVLQQMYVKRALEKVKDADIKRAYEQFKQNYPKGKERSVGHILLDNKSDPQGQAAQSALDSILKGESFEKIAKERSLDRASAEKEGGKIGWIRTDQAPEELREAINATKVGGVFAKLVKTEYGWHIIKVYEERDSVPPAFDEIKDLIRFKVAEGIVRQQLEKFASVAKIELFDLNGQPEKAPVNPADTAQKAG